MNIKFGAFALCLLIFFSQSCAYDELAEPVEPGPCDQTVSYANEVQPIVNTSCAKSGCHNGDLGPDKNWTVFDTFQSKRALVKDRINRPLGVSGHMPADGTIEPEEIQTITCWVDQGGLNN
jgi:hypothetical protein